jgi:predicted transposase/invertase (TIGR01784 family)
VDKELLSDDNVAKAVSLVEESAYSDAELWAIDRYWDSVSRERTALSEKYLKGEAKGREEGRAEGRAEGLAEGEKKGREEGRKEQAYEIARNLMAIHLPIESIVKVTGLSEDEIASLM